jgi:hypothetical protein
MGSTTVDSGQTFTRRHALLGSGAILASAALPPGSRALPAKWGRIANHGSPFRGERTISSLFFGGPENPNSRPLYTRMPRDPRLLEWKTTTDIELALGQMAAAGVNTVKLSYFGRDGETEEFAPALMFSRRRWPGDGDGNYTDAEQVAQARRLFRVAARRGLLVAPLIEVSLRFRFWEDFPARLEPLVERVCWLVGNLGDEPNFLEVYDSLGRPRVAVWLIETIHGGPIDPVVFAAGFDRAAELVRQRTGHRIGFFIDPTPLPGYGSHAGPDPVALRGVESLLGINPYNITSQGPGPGKPQHEITDAERTAYATDIMTRWAGSGLPCIAPVLHGYDARFVFPPPRTMPYGFHDLWMEHQLRLAERFAVDGLSVDPWNGWTEGCAIPPSEQDGNRYTDWWRRVVTHVRRGWAGTDG